MRAASAVPILDDDAGRAPPARAVDAERPADPVSAPSASPAMMRHRLLALRVALALSIGAAVWTLLPYAGWLVLSAWFAALTRPTLDRLARWCGGRRRAAAIMTLALSLVIFVPIALLLASLAADSVELVRSLATAESGQAALHELVSDGTSVAVVPEPTRALLDIRSIDELVRAHSDRAFDLLTMVAGSLVQALFGFMVFFSGAFTLLVHGPRLFTRLEELAPATPAHMRRLHDAFNETGRGLLVGSGLTGLVQAVIATGIYYALDVPRSLVLGFLTFAASVVPGIGTALVWVPVTAGLVIAGRTTQAILMAVLGTVLVSGIDSVVRPFFVRWGRLTLTPFVVMISVFGGLATFGPWGIVFGPIVLRLTLEIARIAREEHLM